MIYTIIYKTFKILEEETDSLKIEKNIIEIQRTIIYYGEMVNKQLEKLEMVFTVEKDKGKQIIEVKKEEKTKQINPFIEHLSKLKLRKDE